MGNTVKFVLALGAMLLLMLAIRTYALTIFADPSTGHRVMVSRLGRTVPDRGDNVVFVQSGTHYCGRVTAMPGDTITLGGEHYLIPTKCVCNNSECDDCRYYLIDNGHQQAVVSQRNIVGKAYRLW